MNLRVVVLSGLCLALFGGAVALKIRAQPPRQALKTLHDLTRRSDVLAAIIVANDVKRVDLATLDQRWRAEAAANGVRPFADRLMSSPLSRQLVLDRLGSQGRVRQIMIMDAHGALVAADAATHDYDQSDEPKWQRTIGAGELAPVHEGRDHQGIAEVDQISQTVVDGNGKPVGAVTLRWCRSGCQTGTP